MPKGQIRSFFPFHQSLVRSRLGLPQVSNVRTRRAYEPIGMYRFRAIRFTCDREAIDRYGHRCNQIRLRLPGWRRDLSQATIFLMPAFITLGS